MKIIQLTLGMMQSHCYILYKQNHAIIIDPGNQPDLIIEKLNQNQLTPLAILLTHGHFDHIGAVDQLVDIYHIPVYLHWDDKNMVHDSQINLSYFDHPFTLKTPLYYYETELKIEDFDFQIIHAPGHSRGSVLLLCKNEHIMFSGDVIFKNSIGRCDFPESSYQQMQNTLNIIKNIQDDYIIYPGHGDETTLNKEKTSNPYLSSI